MLARSDLTFTGQVSAVELDGDDLAMLEVLAADGRAPFSELARAAGVDESRATRRLRALVAAGAVYFDVDISVGGAGLRDVGDPVVDGAAGSAGRSRASAGGRT